MVLLIMLKTFSYLFRFNQQSKKKRNPVSSSRIQNCRFLRISCYLCLAYPKSVFFVLEVHQHPTTPAPVWTGALAEFSGHKNPRARSEVLRSWSFPYEVPILGTDKNLTTTLKVLHTHTFGVEVKPGLQQQNTTTH